MGRIPIDVLALRTGISRRSLYRYRMGDVEPPLGRADDIATALGLKLYIRPREPEPARPTAEAPVSPAPAAPESGPGAALEPVPDRRIAEALAVLADEYEALNPRGRESLLMRFWAAYPDLRERERRLARVVDWLGWRVIAGGRRAASE